MKKKRLREKHIFLDRKYKLFVSHSVFKVNDRMIYVRNSFIPWISNIVFISILFVAFFPAFLIVNYQGYIDVMSRGRIDVTSRGRTNLTSWGCPEITYRGRLNLTFKGRPWEIDSGNLQDVLRTFPRGSSEYSNLDVPTFFLTFLSKLIRLTKSM